MVKNFKYVTFDSFFVIIDIVDAEVIPMSDGSFCMFVLIGSVSVNSVCGLVHDISKTWADILTLKKKSMLSFGD